MGIGSTRGSLSAVTAVYFLHGSFNTCSGCSDGKVRGVNLGGWFVMERWITPKLFEEVNNGGDKVKILQIILKVNFQFYISIFYLKKNICFIKYFFKIKNACHFLKGLKSKHLII